jgi:hypothetical protein
MSERNRGGFCTNEYVFVFVICTFKSSPINRNRLGFYIRLHYTSEHQRFLKWVARSKGGEGNQGLAG